MVEKETINYFQLKVEYGCSQAVRELQGTGIQCSDFADYIPTAVQFYQEHRNDRDKMIMVV